MATEAAAYDDSAPLVRSGWATLATVVMFAVGFARVISAIGYFADSRRVTDLGNGALHDQLWVYGIWDLAVAALALYAGYSLSRGGGFGARARLHLGGPDHRPELHDHQLGPLVRGRGDHARRAGRLRAFAPARSRLGTPSTVRSLSKPVQE